MKVGRVRTRAIWRPDGKYGLCKLRERIKATNPRPISYLSALSADMSHIARSAQKWNVLFAPYKPPND